MQQFGVEYKTLYNELSEYPTIDVCSEYMNNIVNASFTQPLNRLSAVCLTAIKIDSPIYILVHTDCKYFLIVCKRTCKKSKCFDFDSCK